jgi:hypothetical protein
LVGEVAAGNVLPVLDGRVGLPDRLQLLCGQAGRPVVLGVDGHRQRVDGDLKLRVLDAVLLTDRRLLVLLDRARGVRDVRLPVAEALEATTGAGGSHRHVHAGLPFAEELRRGRREGSDRARAVGLDVARELLAAARRGSGGCVRIPSFVAFAAATRRDRRKQRDQQGEQHQPGGETSSHRSPFASCHRRECPRVTASHGLKGRERAVTKW